jgi:hypothetical protein
MPRNVEDIIPSRRRSIRDVDVPEERRIKGRRVTDREPKSGTIIPIHKEHARADEEVILEAEREEAEVRKEASMPRMKAPLYKERRPMFSGFKNKRITWIISAVALVVLAFAIMSFMKSATLAYTPKSAPLNFDNESFTAYKTGSEGLLLFSVVKISDTKGMSVPATGETEVSRKASGDIIVYNAATTDPLTLVKTTRFETSDGKIYRVQSDISIPGKTSNGPGSLLITVVADQPGDTYNIGFSDFTVPGFKGDPKFKTVYGRSKTPMTGGFVGAEKGVSPEALTAAKADLEKTLSAQLVAEAQAQVPADFALFPSLSIISYEDAPQSSSTDSTVNINEKGNFYGVIFKKSNLADYIKTKKLSIPASQAIEIAGMNNLDFQFSGQAPDDLLKATQINFKVNGAATAVWLTDETSLKKDLSGQSKDDISEVLKSYPGILSADAIIRPFWKTSFPPLPGDIKVMKKPLK